MAMLLAIPFYKIIGKIVENILAFLPPFNLLIGTSIILGRPVCALVGLLICKINWLTSKMVRTTISIVFWVKCFNNIIHRSIQI